MYLCLPACLWGMKEEVRYLVILLYFQNTVATFALWVTSCVRNYRNFQSENFLIQEQKFMVPNRNSSMLLVTISFTVWSCNYFQPSLTQLDTKFEFIDQESGVDHHKYQVFQTMNGQRTQIKPCEFGFQLNDGQADCVNQMGLSDFPMPFVGQDIKWCLNLFGKKYHVWIQHRWMIRLWLRQANDYFT